MTLPSSNSLVTKQATYLMPVYQLQLLDKIEIAKDTHVFTFSKPDQFTFIPGQYAGFTLPSLLKTHPTASTKRFSLLSTPHDQHIVIATRKQSSIYKDALFSLSVGSDIKMAGPSGNFILHEASNTPAILLAGGIGITPFYSMIKNAVQTQQNQQSIFNMPIYLFYANRNQAEAAFINDLLAWEAQTTFFKFIPIMTQPTNIESSPWQGEIGYLSAEMIKKYVPVSSSIFYICGSPNMVNSTHDILINDLTLPSHQIKLEDFPGYL